MSVTITVHITKDVLEKTKNCGYDGELTVTNCAVSYALRELFPDAITTNTVCKIGDSLVDLPQEAKDFIRLFDRESPSKRPLMPEMNFNIEVPDEALAHIDISEVHRILKESKTLSLVE